MLTVFGAVISGARHNALRAISPATTKMLLKTVRESDETSENVHVAAICCSAKSLQILHDMPAEERQLDVSLVVEQYQQILTALAAKDGVALVTMIEGVGMISRILNKKKAHSAELQKLLAKHGMLQTLLNVATEVKLDAAQKKTLLPVVIQRISLLLRDCDAACERMSKLDGYRKLFEIVEGLGSPDSSTLLAVLAMATHGDDELTMHDKRLGTREKLDRPQVIQNVEPISCLLRWMRETDYEDPEIQTWLAMRLHALCSSSIQNKMLCCQFGVILQIIECLKKHSRLRHRTAIELLKLVERLGVHSITPFELKQRIMLLGEAKVGTPDSQNEGFPYKSHVIHVVSSMAKGDGYESCRRYFDLAKGSKGLSVPGIRDLTPPQTGLTFHCWLRLDKAVKNRNRRRQLYSLYTSGGNGFEAFITPEGVLTAAVAHKKEFLAVPILDHPITDERWHCVSISHAAAKRPFGSSSLVIFVDGSKRMECGLKFPSLHEPLSYCQIGSPLIRGNVPALNLEAKPTLKEGIVDAIKVGLPGVLNLPGTLKATSNDPNVKWTLIGLEDQLWGRQSELLGQIGAICLFQDSITATQAKMMYAAGPNQGLSFPGAEDSADAVDLSNRVVFHFSARASHRHSCPNLADPSKFEAQVLADSFSTQDVKDVVNCIGGVQALFSLLETAAAGDVDVDIGYLSLRDPDQVSNRSNSVTDEGNDWEMLPSSHFSDWRLEQNAISGFLTLIRNLVSSHTINCEQLMRGGGVAVIGALLQEARPSLVDVNVLMASQLLVELAQSSPDQRLLYQIYHSILFDFRIWSRAEVKENYSHANSLH